MSNVIDGGINSQEFKNEEIERKWLFDPKTIPKDLVYIGEYLYEQAYLSVNPEFRIRKKQELNTEWPVEPTHVLCIKSKKDLSRVEVQKKLTESEFNDLMLVGGLDKEDFIKKNPKAYMVNGYKLIVGLADIGRETEFWYGEIEFTSEEEANSFEAPSWFGREVTYEPEYKMASYWERTRLIGDYIVMAYDKDNDYYHNCLQTSIYDYAVCKAESIARSIEKDEFKNPNNGEPFDWVQVESAFDYKNVLWASYPLKESI